MVAALYSTAASNTFTVISAEFDFRYSNRRALGVEDTERATRALQGVKGKRLTYETTKAI